MERLQSLPFVRWAIIHPRLSAWIALSTGIVILLLIEAQDVGLLPLQWVALIILSVLVAGACVWIVSWEDSDPDADVVEGEREPMRPPTLNAEAEVVVAESGSERAV